MTAVLRLPEASRTSLLERQCTPARFIGDRGFMVTFLQVDPLFTFDLSDPYNPQMKGELKIPGYSTYLHPVGDNYLLGVGQNASEEGWVAGMQVSLFDVTDMDNPVEKFKYTFGDGWTWSEAMYQHKAFQYWERLGLLAVPVQENGDSGFFNGLYLFQNSTRAGRGLDKSLR